MLCAGSSVYVTSVALGAALLPVTAADSIGERTAAPPSIRYLAARVSIRTFAGAIWADDMR